MDPKDAWQDQQDFDALVHFLRNHGYEVRVTKDLGVYDVVEFALVKGKGIKAGFCALNLGESYHSLDGRVAADNERRFDKWANCPLVMHIPCTHQGRYVLLEHLKWLGSEDGYNRTLYPDPLPDERDDDLFWQRYREERAKLHGAADSPS